MRRDSAGRRWGRAALAALACALLSGAGLSGCADVVDTELGLDADIDAARVSTMGSTVSVELDVTYRVGPFAEGERMFQPQGIELYADDALVATLSPMAPPGFQARVAPGEAFTATFPASGDVSDGAAVCAGELRVLFRWLDTTTMEIGMTDAIVPDPTCE
ncbi:MAG TPA: hypothetical protein DEF51_07475 [Myxococcales bacterium]|nr:hypothetical protein [Myxococcales bacterium]